MAKFKTTPLYAVHTPTGKINFDHNGEYETDNAGEITLLKALSPRYLTVVDDGVTKRVSKVTKAEDKPKAKAATKPSGK